METNGEKVYRLFGHVINTYKVIFEICEEEWEHNVQRNSYFDADFLFVSRLPQEDRIQFWSEKIAYFTTNVVEPSPFESGLLDSIYWLHHYNRYEELEAELLQLIRKNRPPRSIIRRHSHPIHYFRDILTRLDIL